MGKSFIYIALLGLIFVPFVFSSCIHDELDIKLEEVTIEDDEEHRMLATNWQGIRMVADYSHLSVSSSVSSYIKGKLLPAAFNYFKAALKVPKLSKLKLSSGSACGLSVPSKYSSTGVDADIVIFVTAESTSASWLAWAKPCQQISGTRRPIVGQINFNTQGISQGDFFEFESDLMVTMHELSHVLGFSQSLFSSWPSGAKVGTKNVNGGSVSYIGATILRDKIRDHFGCSTAVGAYLENQGGSGSAGSHFERRVFFNEYMTASEIKDSKITKFTLALFESTGWYKVDYDMAEPTWWGYHDGCDFLDSRCSSARSSEFCSTMGSYGCYATGNYGGYCGNTGSSSQVLDNFADNCKFIRPYSNMHCEDANDEGGAYLSAEDYGIGSKCFMGTLYPGSGLSSARPYCFKYDCAKQSNGDYKLTVNVGSKSAVCTSAKSISVSGYGGTLHCPNPNQFCTRQGKKTCKRGCMGKGTCKSNGTCACESGWGQRDCSQKTSSNLMADPDVYDDNIETFETPNTQPDDMY